jgi:hypothetical protein
MTHIAALSWIPLSSKYASIMVFRRGPMPHPPGNGLGRAIIVYGASTGNANVGNVARTNEHAAWHC